MESLILRLQEEVSERKQARSHRDHPYRIPLVLTGVACAAMLLGAGMVGDGSNAWAGPEARERTLALHTMNERLAGELALERAKAERLQRMVEYSARFGIPADLAAAIDEAARAEGIDPEIAFGLVRVESNFSRTAVSSAGAIGLTQVLPSTAEKLSPGIDRREMFDRDTNLRLGFRYLGLMLERYDGDLRLALLAYNRGPTRVDSILATGQDPGNGYATRVLAGE